MLRRSGKSKNKLEMIAENAKDPYCVAVQNDDLMGVLPLVEFGDLYHYLITAAPSPVTKDELKAWKTMDGRNYLFSGWIGNVSVYPATADGLAEGGGGNEDDTFAGC